MDSPDISVYGEAKGEYTRQLCVFLVPTLETYILGLLEEAKAEAPNPKKVLWQFQTILQGIPDWNQDKVVRETEKIQKDCNCDYLEELLTAVFIAHTKVLSAIRLTTRQKKLQITIPKLDHFLHRLLSEAARNLWTNAYLFADNNAIEKQKNFRQVSGLLNESVLQAIRGLLPVKSILREYLHDDDDETGDVTQILGETGDAGRAEGESGESGECGESGEAGEAKEAKEAVVGGAGVEAEAEVKAEVEVKPEVEVKEEVKEEVKAEVKAEAEAEVKEEVKPEVKPEVTDEVKQASATEAPPSDAPIIQVDAKPSVTFSSDHVFFDSESLEANEIQDIPFLEEDEEDFTVSDQVLSIETDTL